MHLLTYYHTRNLFAGSDFKKWVCKYFTGVEYMGTKSGNYSPSILVTNYEEVKKKLPKSYLPIQVQFAIKNFEREGFGIVILRHLVNGDLSSARERGAAMQPKHAVGETRNEVITMKKFTINFNIGHAKYLVSYYDGIKKHKDGSEFFDIRIFSNKKKLVIFTSNLSKQGYIGEVLK